jgi:hypothetical protein
LGRLFDRAFARAVEWFYAGPAILCILAYADSLLPDGPHFATVKLPELMVFGHGFGGQV